MWKVATACAVVAVSLGITASTARAQGPEGTCVIIPNLHSAVEELGQGVVQHASAVCDAGAQTCAACLIQCEPFVRIRDNYGCLPDGFCDPGNPEDPDCVEDFDDLGAAGTPITALTLGPYEVDVNWIDGQGQWEISTEAEAFGGSGGALKYADTSDTYDLTSGSDYIHAMTAGLGLGLTLFASDLGYTEIGAWRMSFKVAVSSVGDEGDFQHFRQILVRSQYSNEWGVPALTVNKYYAGDTNWWVGDPRNYGAIPTGIPSTDYLTVDIEHGLDGITTFSAGGVTVVYDPPSWDGVVYLPELSVIPGAVDIDSGTTLEQRGILIDDLSVEILSGR